MLKLKTGIIWNLLSYLFLAGLTLLLYVLITTTYGKSYLGAYNIVMSFYTLSGHLGVWGLQSAAVFFVAQTEGEKTQVSKYFSAALVLVFIVSSIVAVILFCLSDFVGNGLYASEYVALGIKAIGPAIVLFSINKLILGYLNGFHEMIPYGILQTTRYFVIVLFVIIIIALQKNFTYTMYSFCAAEVVVLLLGSICVQKHVVLRRPERNHIWHNFSFGSRAVFGNILEDFNTRVDLMMLGLLGSDRDVGLYSFISLMIEGLFKLLYIIRSNLNPFFAKISYRNQSDELFFLYKKARRWVGLGMAGGGILLVAAYGLLCNCILDAEYRYTIGVLGVIILGMTVMAPFFVCGNICTQAGEPLADSAVTLGTMIVNVTANYFLILRFGLYGAAIATSISYLTYAIFMGRMIRLKAHP